MAGQKIGDLNGNWAFLFKVGLSVLPFAVMWMAWAIVAIVSMQASGFTQRDAIDMRQEIEEKMPPEWVSRMLQSHEVRIGSMEQQ